MRAPNFGRSWPTTIHLVVRLPVFVCLFFSFSLGDEFRDSILGPEKNWKNFYLHCNQNINMSGIWMGVYGVHGEEVLKITHDGYKITSTKLKGIVWSSFWCFLWFWFQLWFWFWIWFYFWNSFSFWSYFAMLFMVLVSVLILVLVLVLVLNLVLVFVFVFV
jgi:hypothetical protein